jgi:signal transduction histidine kinase
MLAEIGAIALQAAASIGLLIRMQRRKYAEAFLRQSEERLLTIQEVEDHRITNELHDSTVQHLTAMDLDPINLKTAASERWNNHFCQRI